MTCRKERRGRIDRGEKKGIGRGGKEESAGGGKGEKSPIESIHLGRYRLHSTYLDILIDGVTIVKNYKTYGVLVFFFYQRHGGDVRTFLTRQQQQQK